ncbi:MAG: TlyA family RNA methyltransferase [Pseudomonadota bacterium]|nr:TlyA family RNA methyltransferase [Pseudomonadota bacterium]
MRADQLLVARGHAPTRSAAQRLIDRGAVRWLGPKGWAVPRKAGEDLPDGCQVEVTDDAELRFVSRGGLKLEAALDRCGITVEGLHCLDAGQSTGGFTDLLLQRGAADAVGIDVGHGQLHPRLAADPRVSWYEGVNARDVTGTEFAREHAEASFDVVTGDLSFISLTLVLPTLRRYLAPNAHLLMLVKPQFELQPEHIGKGGLVKDPRSFVAVEARIRAACTEQRLTVCDYFQSSITGGGHGVTAGNTEFFVWARPAA